MENNTGIEQEIINLENNVVKFERALRTSLNASDSNNHIQIQKLNRLCNDIKLSVSKLLNSNWLKTSLKFKAWQVVASANFFVWKFEQAINSWLQLHWDILSQLWKSKIKRGD